MACVMAREEVSVIADRLPPHRRRQNDDLLTEAQHNYHCPRRISGPVADVWPSKRISREGGRDLTIEGEDKGELGGGVRRRQCPSGSERSEDGAVIRSDEGLASRGASDLVN